MTEKSAAFFKEPSFTGLITVALVTHPGLVFIAVVIVNVLNVTIVVVIDVVVPIYRFDDDGGQAVIVRRSDLCPTRPDMSPVTLKIH